MSGEKERNKKVPTIENRARVWSEI